LCAAASTDDASMYAQLMLATSPQTYSSASSGSAVQLVAPAQNQQQCQTCAAFAVAAAAETAVASVLQVDVRECSISVQALYACPPGRPTRSCSAGWNLPDALAQLQQRGQTLPTTACLPYTPDFREQMTAGQLCTGKCSTPNQHASKGQFSSNLITSSWKAQEHIRRYGAVVSRFDVSRCCCWRCCHCHMSSNTECMLACRSSCKRMPLARPLQDMYTYLSVV
jgi:hypothetical protein